MIAQTRKAFAAGTLHPRDVVDGCFARIADPAGEGGRTMLAVYAERARAMAEGPLSGPLAGIPISIKDLFDVAGEPTHAASPARAGVAPATATAPAVARVLAAGAIPVGRTNMTQFAFSGLGLNPHAGTPRNPWDRATGRIPGGSSSGAAVSVADGMALGALGTDTGGSCRIPAALCGVVGFKPTQARVPREGALPLSPTLDSIGPLAVSVADCALIDAVLASDPPAPLHALDIRGLVLPVAGGWWLEGLDRFVATAFERAVRRLSDAGAVVRETRMAAYDAVPEVHVRGSFAAAEAWAWHRDPIAARGGEYDPMVRDRIERGAAITPDDVAWLRRERARLIAASAIETAMVEAVLMPTVPIVAPAIADLAEPAAWIRTNALVLRNPSVVNFLDGCSISLPIHRAGEPPVGLMLSAPRGHDRRLLAVAAAVERVLLAA